MTLTRDEMVALMEQKFEYLDFCQLEITDGMAVSNIRFHINNVDVYVIDIIVNAGYKITLVTPDKNIFWKDCVLVRIAKRV